MFDIVNLLTIGISSFNTKLQVPSDISDKNQYIDKTNLQTQQYLTNINEWTKQKKMLINEEKSKFMIFNYTNDYQFSTRLSIQNRNLEEVSETKLLGTIITNDLKWKKNTDRITKRQMQGCYFFKKVSSFTKITKMH